MPEFAGRDGPPATGAPAKGGKGDDLLVSEGGRDTLTGGHGADTVKAKGGHHLLRGGPGGDRIRAHDGKRDTVRCGPGDDVVWADGRDRVGRDCETSR